MKALIIVNRGPWSSSLPVTAFRLSSAMHEGGVDVAAVYFRGEGVYHARPGRATDAGTPNLTEAWLEWSGRHNVPLLLCSADSQRRLEGAESGGFREAGLPEVFELMAGCDRVVSF